jgi:hypothetical protein
VPPAAAPARGPRRPRSRLARAAVVAGGLVLVQAVLFGPSLAGFKILLPLDLLTVGRTYLPPAPQYRDVRPHDFNLSDEVLAYEPMRRFAAAEVRAGRLPTWAPSEYCGAPFAAFPKFSLFNLLYYLFPTPYSLAWIQLLKSLIAGVGAYLFFRRALGAGFWPAAVGAWCYPVTGFFVLWQGSYLSHTAALFPWLLLATDRVVRRPAGWWGPALAVVTALLLLTGSTDIAGEALVVAGLFALWRLAARRRRGWRRLAGAAASLGLAWVLGLLLAAPYLLPLARYVPTGARMVLRAKGAEERPPVGLAALPQTVLPLAYGSSQDGAAYLLAERPGHNLLESAAGAYAGLLAALVLAPLAWCSRRHRNQRRFWLLAGLLGLAWVLNVVPVVAVLRLPGLNMFSFNRLTFVTGFAVLVLAVAGLDVLRRGVPARRGWYVVPAVVLAVLAAWCLDRAGTLPEPYASQLEEAARHGFRTYHLAGAVCCGLGCVAWAALWVTGRPRHRQVLRAPRLPSWWAPAAGAVLVGELLLFARGFNPQCDPALYYPPVPALEEVAARPPGRVLGLRCLPPLLGEVAGLRDVRGYDAVDPLRMVEVLGAVQDPRHPSDDYAMLLYYVPLLPVEKSGRVRLPPVLSMLNLRHLIGRGRPPGPMPPVILRDDYWVWENKDCLPRAFVPATVRRAPDKRLLLRLVCSPAFDPRRVAYADDPPALPGPCRGTAEVVDEVPDRVTLRLDMKTPGLVVLADAWYEGWHATLDGEPLPVLRVNHVLRGVAVPAGVGTLEFAYRQPGLAAGLRLALGALAGLLLWAAARAVLARRRSAGRAGQAGFTTPAPGTKG